jgi:hypothetical protein
MSDNERDELAWVIFRSDNSNIPEDQLREDFKLRDDYCRHIADALLAAGWKRPA